MVNLDATTKHTLTEYFHNEHILGDLWRGIETGLKLQAIPEPAASGNQHLPDLELTGFEQKASKKNESVIDSLIDTVKEFVGNSDTLSSQVRNKIVDNLSPDQKKAYDHETEKIKEYEEKIKEYERLSFVEGISCELPERLSTPMVDEVNLRTLEQERKIAAGVEAQMSPEDLKRVNKQLSVYQSSEYRPYPSVVMERAQPGNALKDYWDRIREATDAFTGK